MTYMGTLPRFGKNVVTIKLPEGFDRNDMGQRKALLEFAKAAALESNCFGNRIDIRGDIAEIAFYND